MTDTLLVECLRCGDPMPERGRHECGQRPIRALRLFCFGLLLALCLGLASWATAGPPDWEGGTKQPRVPRKLHEAVWMDLFWWLRV